MMDKFNEIVLQIRGCLVSLKGQLTLRQLNDDFYTLMGYRIPYQEFGFKTLEDFLQTVPSIVLTRSGGQTMVDAQVSKNSAHISSMVRQQKTKKPSKSATRYKTHHFSNRPPANANKWRPKINFRANQQQASTNRLQAVSHNQFVNNNNSNSTPKVASKIVVPHGANSSIIKEKRSEQASLSVSTVSTNSSIKEDCSPLSSAKKRITKLMHDVSLDCDSGTSSPTTEYSFNNSKNSRSGATFVKTGDAICDLKNFVQFYKLPEPNIDTIESRTRNSKKTIYRCKITVGQRSYISYPDDFFTPHEAEQKASQRALDDLIVKHTSNRKSLLISSNEDIIERIPPMLEKHDNAVWMWQIEEDYIDKFSEQLPSDWLQIIDRRSDCVTIVKCPHGCVLKYCNPSDKGKQLDISLNVMDVSVPYNTVEFGDGNRLVGLITAASSIDEIWCQHCGTAESQKFNKILEEMEIYYEQNKEKNVPAKINFGSCYAAYHDGAWVRVRALAEQNNKIDSFLIDYGEEVNIPKENIFLLRRQFAFIGAQAFVCRLSGLDNLADASIESEHLAALIGREFLIEMDELDGESRDDITVPVVMYDYNTGKSINEELISVLTIDSATPLLDKTHVTDVHVSNIESNGDVYVQVRTPGYWRLVEMLKNIQQTFAKRTPVELRAKLDKNKTNCERLFLVKSEEQWMRCKIIDWSPQGDYAQIYFVDYGNTTVIRTVSEIMLPLDVIDDVVAKYPEQAVKVRINIQKIPADFVQRAEKLMPKDSPILVKIINYDSENVAWVEFFKRSAEGGLFCINKSIDIEAELQDLDSANNNDRNAKKRLMNLVQFNDKNVPSGGALKKPHLPKKDEYFNVKVPFAVNPWNFFVQPLESLAALDELMRDMQAQYRSVHFSPLRIEDVVPGQIYASRHEDGKWYRTSVLKVIHPGSISVFYCDFGYYTNLTLGQLVPLDVKYMALPHQALKAKITGIRPRQSKWTVEDCEYFKNLVTDKHFVSVVASIEKDELYWSDIILKLMLIDTSDSQKDLVIKDLLVKEGIATNAP